MLLFLEFIKNLLSFLPKLAVAELDVSPLAYPIGAFYSVSAKGGFV